MKIFAVTPGSPSTKIGLFADEREIFLQTVGHEAEELAKFSEISEQRPYRLDKIRSLLRERGISLEGTDAFVGRGGGLLPDTGPGGGNSGARPGLCLPQPLLPH